MIEPYRVVAHAHTSYPVYVDEGLLDDVGEIARSVSTFSRAFIITPSTLQEAFAESVAESFGEAQIIAIPDGEEAKTLITAHRIITALLELGAQRDSLAVVVGGGVAGDCAGFAASVFLRGIDLIHVPTTLLAQVDSSIGGKVAVNHPLGKNLIGSFYTPKAVISDIAALESLPETQILSGLYEALKSGVIGDAELFEFIENRRSEIMGKGAEALSFVVRRSVDVKSRIVSADEREADLRRLLNYGHTLAHGIETALDYTGITHGEAVAWGMIGANALAVRRGLIDDEERKRIDDAILAYGPARPSGMEADAITRAAEFDKKFVGGKRVMVLADSIGKCVVVDDVTEQELIYARDAMLERMR